MAEPFRTFTGTVQRPDNGPGQAVALPFDPRTVFGRARIPVVVSIADHPPFRTTIASYGGTAWIGLRKNQLADFGIDVGDVITMTVRADGSPRELELPDELATALAGDATAAELFGRLSFSHRREYASWVGEAKRPSTRDRRAAEALDRVRNLGGAAPPAVPTGEGE